MPAAEGTTEHERRRAAESLLAFWAEAGVDVALADEPRDRTTRTAAIAERPAPVRIEPVSAPAVSAVPAALLETVRSRAREADSLEALKTVAWETQIAERLVFWRGAEQAEVMVLGEAPTAEDDLGGEPFLGAGGRLLDRMLAAAGLTGRALIGHAIFHRPPGDRAPTTEEQALAAPILERVIQLTGARALLLLGAGAARGMLKREEPITALRGRWLEWRSADGELELPALVAFGPALLLRQPLAKRQAWADLLLFTERLDRPPGRGA